MNDCLKYSQRSVPGEEVVEPEVDLSAFLERQRLSHRPSSAPPPPDEDDDGDWETKLLKLEWYDQTQNAIAHIPTLSQVQAPSAS